MNLLALLQVHRAWQISPYGPRLVSISVYSALLFGALGLLIASVLGMDFTSLVTTCVIGSAAYGGVLWEARGELNIALLWSAIRTRRSPRI